MKTRDNYFRGFPAVWNVIAFYIFLLEPPGWLSFAAVVALGILSFVPVTFVHPMRVREFRALNVVLLVIWSVLAFWALVEAFAPARPVTWGLVVIAVYFLLAGLLRRPTREEV
jgi:phosphatidylcholine synthase